MLPQILLLCVIVNFACKGLQSLHLLFQCRAITIVHVDDGAVQDDTGALGQGCHPCLPGIRPPTRMYVCVCAHV